MKIKGFTLVELLAVIVILAVIAIITIPMIGNVIEDSKKKSLETSVYGLVEAANYFTISNDGKYGFVFNEELKGKTEDEKYALDYSGDIDAEGKLYINVDGDVSLCLMNEKYYVYKNYNSGIIIGDRKENTCVAEYDPLINKYIAYLEGEGEGSNVYSKEEITELLNDYALKTDLEAVNTSLNTLITENKSKIENLEQSVQTNSNSIITMQNDITSLQNNLSNYALQSSLDQTNNNVNYIATLINNTDNNVAYLKTLIDKNIDDISTNAAAITNLQNNKASLSNNTYNGTQSGIKNIAPSTDSYHQAAFVSYVDQNNYPEARAGYGFHNGGVVGGYLYLENNGQLKFINNNGQIFTVNMTLD